jgi:hypothetical protein
MKEQHRYFLFVFSCLLISALTVVVIRMGGYSKEVICNAMATYVFNMSCYDQTPNVESIFAKTSMPGKDKKEAWWINIASFQQTAKANELVEYSRNKGFDANKTHISVNGKEYWRVSVKADMSYNKVNTYAFFIKDLLGLEEIWISK